MAIKSQAGVDKSFYINYRKNGKLVHEKVGRASEGWTAAKAATERVERIKADALTNQQRREKERANKYTFDKLFEEYEENKPENKSLLCDRYSFKKHISPHIGDKTPPELSPLDIDRLRRRQYSKLKPQTVKHILSFISRLSNFAKKRNLGPGLSFAIEYPKIDNQTTEFLTDIEIAKLKKACSESIDRQAADMVLLALATGMRRGEIYKLLWDNVDFARNRIFIRDPKGHTSIHIPMNDAARAVLQNHPRHPSSLYVFCRPKGTPYTDRKHNARELRRLYDTAGLSGTRPLHGLRHTFSSLLANNGVDLQTIQKLTTHKSYQMVLRYSHLRDDGARRASELLSTIIENVKDKGATDAESKD